MKHKSFCTLKTEVVINIYKELNEDVPTNPHNETHESVPNAVSTFATEIVATVDVALTLDHVDLLHLPVFVHWHPAVGLQNIRFPHY
jgi:hypothetical protein